ncbi:MAG: hypothetical protein BWY66_02830 [bacterium ADurb.Bin374]|nr:MAG: hypothetical protein BWY66_02830 [bacterium ADurb.Bin374]
MSSGRAASALRKNSGVDSRSPHASMTDGSWPASISTAAAYPMKNGNGM